MKRQMKLPVKLRALDGGRDRALRAANDAERRRQRVGLGLIAAVAFWFVLLVLGSLWASGATWPSR